MDSSEKVVTKIEQQKGRKDRVSVFLDGEFAFGLHQNLLVDFDLFRGKRLSEETVAAILKAEERYTAKERAFRWLSFRSRSRKEIEQKLRQAKFSEEAIQFTLAELERLRFLDDAGFARLFAHDRLLRHPMGRRLLEKELRQKGIDPEVIAEVLSEAYAETSEAEMAVRLLRKKAPQLARSDAQKARQKAVRFLSQRGFDWETIQEALENHRELFERGYSPEAE